MRETRLSGLKRGEAAARLPLSYSTAPLARRLDRDEAG
jgi:hypothetical protein